MREAIRQIRAGKGKHISSQSNRISIWWVVLDKQAIPVVYDKKRGTIASVLAADSWQVKNVPPPDIK